MLITGTPLRITLGGGGTDLPSFYGRHGGFVLAGAINRYIYVAINRTFTNDYFLKYSELERVASPGEIRHPILREVLTADDIGPALEIDSVADIPAGTGLGSSGAFTVGLLKAVYAFRREHVTAGALAEEACDIEIRRLGRAVGKQDQNVAAYGGLIAMEIDQEGEVKVSPLGLSSDLVQELEERMLLYFTGYSRSADSILTDQDKRTSEGDSEIERLMLEVKAAARDVRDAILDGDIDQFGKLLHEHWVRKRTRSVGMSNRAIDRWYEVARRHGAIGGKLVGAGGGGFLLFVSAFPGELREAMKATGLPEVRFVFEHDGSSVIVRA